MHLHEIHAREVFGGRIDAAKVFAGNSQPHRLPGANAYKHGIEILF